jgi:HD-like signal output (HDOD) protein
VRTFPGIPVSIATMDGCWGASIRVAVAAREIAQQCGNGRAEVVFVAGLLHDVGRLVMLLQSPQSFLLGRETPRRAAAGRPTDARVRERWPPDHARVGAALLSAWRLPACLQTCVAHRHQPERAAGFRTEAAIVHVAHGLAVLAAADSEDFRDAPPIAPAAWSRVGIRPERGLAILPAVRKQADEARRLFDA